MGQVYGRHLQLGGAEVAFLVKEKHAAELRRGLTVYALNTGASRLEPKPFTRYEVLTQAAEVGQSAWDQVYLTMSSPALAGPWLPELAAQIGSATVVGLQPGLEDRARLLECVAEDQAVSGLITLISYNAPLPGEARFARPGLAYWFPPLTPSPLSGPEARTRAVVAELSKGGLPSKRHPDVPRSVAIPNAILTPHLLALEASGWSFRDLGRSAALRLAARGAHEAIAVMAHKLGTRVPWLTFLVRPSIMKLGLALARRVVPLDLQTYLQVHFTKVGDQTRFFMKNYIELGQKLGVSVAAMEELMRL